MSSTTINSKSRSMLHLCLAEAGKARALQGDHTGAMSYYREAIRVAVEAKSPEVFFRHYTQCVLESLELTGSYQEVIEFCVDADRHYRSLDVSSGLHRSDHGALLERLGLVYLKLGDTTSAKHWLLEACQLAGDERLPLSVEVLGWLKRGYSVDSRRLLASQRKHQYFVVREGQVDHALAAKAPTNLPGVTPLQPKKAGSARAY